MRLDFESNYIIGDDGKSTRTEYANQETTSDINLEDNSSLMEATSKTSQEQAISMLLNKNLSRNRVAAPIERKHRPETKNENRRAQKRIIEFMIFLKCIEFT